MGTGNIAQSCYIINKSRQFIPGQKLLKQPGDSHVLRSKTADVLLLLLQTPGQVVHTKTFFDVVWRGKFVSENVLKQSISELRHCLCDEHKKLIVTLPKTGYLLQCSVEFINPEKINSATEEVPQPSEGLSTFDSDSDNPTQAPASIPAENIPIDKALPVHGNFTKLRYLAATVVLVATGLFLNSYVQAQQAVVLEMQNKNAELQAGLALYMELHSMSVQIDQHQQKDAKSLLDEKLQELLGRQSLTVTYLGQMDALKDLYTRKGFFDEALLLANRLERGVEIQYGQHSERLIRTKLETINILLELQRSEEALNKGHDLLLEVQKYYPYNRKLLAEVNFLVSRTYL